MLRLGVHERPGDGHYEDLFQDFLTDMGVDPDRTVEGQGLSRLDKCISALVDMWRMREEIPKTEVNVQSGLEQVIGFLMACRHEYLENHRREIVSRQRAALREVLVIVCTGAQFIKSFSGNGTWSSYLQGLNRTLVGFIDEFQEQGAEFTLAQLVHLHLALLWGDPRQAPHNLGQNGAKTKLDQTLNFYMKSKTSVLQALSWHNSCAHVEGGGGEGGERGRFLGSPNMRP